MEKRRSSSSFTPNTPQCKIDKKSGEKKGYGKGNYNRDTDNGTKKRGFINKTKPHGKNKYGGKPKAAVRIEKDYPPVVSDDQVTDGKYRGEKLKVSASPKMAPTNRPLRELFFKILFRRVRARRFLDICSGTGTVGIDAISRGALIATFVERKAKQCALIRENLETLGISEGHGEVIETEVVSFLKNMSKRRRTWDLVYFSPPDDYNYDEALEYFRQGVTIDPKGVFVIEHHAEMFFPEELGVLRRWKVVVEGERAMSFYDYIRK